MIKQNRMIALAKWLGAISIGLVVLWQTAQRVTSHDSGVVVHVMEGGAAVMIDDQFFQGSESVPSQIVVDLPPGRHELKMFLHGALLYDEPFSLGRGEEQVHTAWNCLGRPQQIATR